MASSVPLLKLQRTVLSLQPEETRTIAVASVASAAKQSTSFSLGLLHLPGSLIVSGLALSYMKDSSQGKRTLSWQVGLGSGVNDGMFTLICALVRVKLGVGVTLVLGGALSGSWYVCVGVSRMKSVCWSSSH